MSKLNREEIASQYFHVGNGGYTVKIAREPNRTGLGKEKWIYFLITEFTHHGWPASTGEVVIPSKEILDWYMMHLMTIKGEVTHTTDYGQETPSF